MNDIKHLLVERLTLVQSSFLTELSAAMKLPLGEVERVVKDLDGALVIVVHHTPPDPHIDADLRVVSLIDVDDPGRAFENADAVWQSWLREFFQSHRCS
jgi:hypothetical protein